MRSGGGGGGGGIICGALQTREMRLSCNRRLTDASRSPESCVTMVGLHWKALPARLGSKRSQSLLMNHILVAMRMDNCSIY